MRTRMYLKLQTNKIRTYECVTGRSKLFEYYGILRVLQPFLCTKLKTETVNAGVLSLSFLNLYSLLTVKKT